MVTFQVLASACLSWAFCHTHSVFRWSLKMKSLASSFMDVESEAQWVEERGPTSHWKIIVKVVLALRQRPSPPTSGVQVQMLESVW